MRRFLAPVLALLAACCLSTAALAGTQGTQTLSTTVPDPTAPSWTLNIPADTAVPYRATETPIGDVTVSDVQNVEDGYLIGCSVSNTDFASGADIIPLTLEGDFYADGILYETKPISDGTPFELYAGHEPSRVYSTKVIALVEAGEWDAAVPGVYTATVTYTSRLYLGV